MRTNKDADCLCGDTPRFEMRALPHKVYYGLAIVLGICGLLASVYLSVSHYRVHTDISYRSFCAISNSFNCDTVSQSPFSVFFGLPVAVWGGIGYAGLTMLTAFAGSSAAGNKRIWSLVFVVALMFSLIGLLLAGVSTYKVGSYCIVCIATYAVNLALLFLTWIVRRRFKCEPLLVALWEDIAFLRRYARSTVGIFLVFTAAVVGAYRLIPPYWEVKSPPAANELKRGQTTDGVSWIGAEDPLVTIVEFSDYQCFQCRKMHFYLRELMSKHPDAIRLVHRNYPMDHEFNFIVQDPFHVGSGNMALLAIHAEAHGKFWEMNDILYRLAGSGREIDLRQIADETGLELAGLASALNHPGYRKRLEIDIRHGMKVRALGTPSYLIDGQLHQGTIPAEVLSVAVNR